MKNVIRIGTRQSALALAQSLEVKKRLQRRFKNFKFQLVSVNTTGDRFRRVTQWDRSAVGVFTKELERALRHGKLDLAVHSLKDLPTEIANGLCLAAITRRLDPRDVLVSRHGASIQKLPPCSRVGTGSPRRKCQLARLRPDLKLIDIRGNLDTRIKKALLGKEVDAVVVARAGLLRLKKFSRFASIISEKILLPAVGQAALAIEVRKKDKRIFKMVRSLNHLDTEIKTRAERMFLKTLEGGCRVPVGITSQSKNGRLWLKAGVFSPNTTDALFAEISGPVSESRRLGQRLGRILLQKGAVRFLKEARHD